MSGKFKEMKNKKMNFMSPIIFGNKSKRKTVNPYSSFWLDDNWNSTPIEVDTDVKKGLDLIKLSSYRRAISNFVSIVTGKNIPVTFVARGDSYTDGKKVTISSKLDDKIFDSTVGLALHEGSHILLSDFEFLKNLEFNIPQEYMDSSYGKGFSKSETLGNIKNLLNYIEDKRIDYFIFSTSPGYKGYYHSMYDKYFNARIIDKALKSTEYIDETVESYLFRIVNLTNTNTDLNALNGLREIYNLIDFRNISRLKDSASAFGVALDVYDVILNNIPDGIENIDSETGEVTYEKADGSDGDSTESGGESGSGSSDGTTMSDEEFDDLLDSVENGEMENGSGNGTTINIDFEDDTTDTNSSSSEMGNGNSNSTDSTTNVSEDKTNKIELSDNQKKQLENAIKKQEKFLNDEITKKKVSKKDKASLDAVEKSGMEYREVGETYNKETSWRKNGIDCIVVNNFTKELVDSGTVDMVNGWRDHQKEVDDGIRLGTILGRKLKVRTESRDTKYTRKNTGKIDKRLISQLGFGNESVFCQNFVDSYPDAFLHISVDASGSMSGDKFSKALTSVVAVTKALDMIQGIDVVVSFRTTQNVASGRGRYGNDKPLILVAYDSRKDNFVKVRTLFKYLSVNGTTPEGLTFEAIMDDLIPSSNERDSFFLNFSDGMPMYGNEGISYHGESALNHTKGMVKKMRNKGIKVLSYFIGSSYESNSTMESFKTMYGRDSQFVNVTSVMEVAKTMNSKFLEK